MNLNDRIAVLGWSGFVGKNLIERMEKDGYTRIIKSRVDLTNPVAVEEFFRQYEPKYVINLSGKVGGIEANRKDNYGFLLKNVLMQSNVIDYSIKHRVEKVLNLGSSCIYPANYEYQPLKEEYLLDGPLEKTNEGYALAKIVGLKLAEYANRQQDRTDFITLMPSNLYGPYDHFDIENGHALAALILKTYKAIKNQTYEIEVWGNGLARREWMHVSDLCDAILWSMNTFDRTETFLNVGTGEDIAMNDLAVKIMNQFGNPVIIKNDKSKPNGMMLKKLDVSKINSLGWKSKISLDSGIDNTVSWFLRNCVNE